MPLRAHARSWMFQGNDAANLGAGYTGDAPGDTPVYHLDGTITGDTMVDLVGGYVFDITNKDFDSDIYGGIPFKSIATISAPSSGAAKTAVLAVDVNNFWYDGADDPNAIPIISFFQNIDFGNQLFCEHTDRVVNGDSEETTPPLVTNIVGYAAAQTITSAFTTYFGSEVTRPTAGTDKFVSKGGNDGGDGTWATPWLTIQHAEDTIDDEDTIYVLGGLYDEDSGAGYLHVDNNGAVGHYFISTGAVTITSPGTASVIYSYRGNKKFTGFVIDGETNTTSCVGGSAFANEQEFYQCHFARPSTTALASGVTNNILSNCISDSQTEINLSYNGTITGCYIRRMKVTAINAQANTYTLHYNKFVEGTEASLWVVNGASTSMTNDMKYNRFDVKDIGINVDLEACTAFTLERNNFYSLTGGTSFRAIDFSNSVTSGDTCVPSIKYNYFQGDHETGVVINLNAPAFDDPEVMYNVFKLNHASANVRAITFSTALNSGAYKANYNRIFIEGASAGYGIESGETGGTAFNGAEIIGNYIRGHLYNNPLSTGGTLHGIAASRGVNITMAYNRVEYVPLACAIKGGATAYTSGGCFGNIFYECEAGPYVRQTDGLKFYNNTVVNNEITCLKFMSVDDEDGNNTDNLVIQNNVFHSVTHAAGNGMFYVDDTVQARNGLLLDNNIYNPPGAMTVFIYHSSDFTYAQAVTNTWAANGDVESPTFESLATGDLRLAVGSNGVDEGDTLAAAYDDDLDATTDWNIDDTDVDPDNYPTIVTKQQTGSWDKGAYVI